MSSNNETSCHFACSACYQSTIAMSLIVHPKFACQKSKKKKKSDRSKRYYMACALGSGSGFVIRDPLDYVTSQTDV